LYLNDYLSREYIFFVRLDISGLPDWNCLPDWIFFYIRNFGGGSFRYCHNTCSTRIQYGSSGRWRLAQMYPRAGAYEFSRRRKSNGGRRRRAVGASKLGQSNATPIRPSRTRERGAAGTS